MSFLDYSKMILDRVSVYPELFVKEYKKAKRHLQESDMADLNRWINARGFHILFERVQQEAEN
jgi:hypothetical protein